MDSLVQWFTENLGQYIGREWVVFIISLLPLLECRGGLLAASLLQVPLLKALPICIIGNILPIPFILIFIKKIFQWLKKYRVFKPIIEKIETRALQKSTKVTNGEFLALLLFVGIPLPGTGAWTGSLIAALLEMNIKKASIAIFLGVLLATVIMSIVSYGLLGLFI